MGRIVKYGDPPPHSCELELSRDGLGGFMGDFGTIWECSCGNRYTYRMGWDDDGYVPGWYLNT